MVVVAQLVRALDCGSRCRGFESRLPPPKERKHLAPRELSAFFVSSPLEAMQERRQYLYFLARSSQSPKMVAWSAKLAKELSLTFFSESVTKGLRFMKYSTALPLGEDEETGRLNLLKALLPHLRHSDYLLYLPRVEARADERWAFDLDGTLIPDELLPLLAESHDCPTPMARLTEEAMEGHVPFTTSFTERTRLLAGLPVSTLLQLATSLDLPEGSLLLLDQLRQLGRPLALVSGNYAPLVRQLAERLTLPHAIGSEVHLDEEGRLLGLLPEAIVDEARKRDFLLHWGDPLTTCYVGDGANDLPALAIAGHAFLVGAGFVRADGLAYLAPLPTALTHSSHPSR